MILKRTLTATAVLAIAAIGLMTLSTPSAEAAYERMHAAVQRVDGIRIQMVRHLPDPVLYRTILVQGSMTRIEETGKSPIIVREGYQFQKQGNRLDRSVSAISVKDILAVLDFRNVKATYEAGPTDTRVRLIGIDRPTLERLVRLQIEPAELVDWATRVVVSVDSQTNLPVRAVREAYVDERWQVQLTMDFQYDEKLSPDLFDPMKLAP